MEEPGQYNHSLHFTNQNVLGRTNGVKKKVLFDGVRLAVGEEGIKKYYNSKYIDAEETDVSRNQTSTWLIDDWSWFLCSDIAGPIHKSNNSFLHSL